MPGVDALFDGYQWVALPMIMRFLETKFSGYFPFCFGLQQ
jgi:hypothetical protein